MKLKAKPISSLVKAVKNLAPDEKTRTKLVDLALDIAIAYAEAKVKGKEKEFIVKFTKEW